MSNDEPGDDPRGDSGAVIRRAGPDDLALLVELHAEFCAADGHTFDAATARAGLAPLLEDDAEGTAWVILGPDDRDDGYAVLARSWSVEIGGPEVVLDEIYVRTRGVGLGGRAVDALAAECRRRGVKRMFLETERASERARGLYARHGFVEDDSIWMSYRL